MNINLTHILLAIIDLIVVIITYRLVPWIKARTTNEQQAYIRALVKAGVYAAEQIYRTEGMGTKKMEYVRTFLRAHGYDVNVTEIEAAVSEYINKPADAVVVPLEIDEDAFAKAVYKPPKPEVETPAE